jgi:dUTP pyrophosphatase
MIRIKYLHADSPRLAYSPVGDWLDLYTAVDVALKEGEHMRIPLGVCIELPKGYEALLIPRSSTFERYGLMQSNSIGLIDESYNGDNDQWHVSVYATRDVEIPKWTRLNQFRLIEHMPRFEIAEVETLGNDDRSGFGSTGK